MLYRKVGSNVRLLNYITHDANGEDVTGSVSTDNRPGRGCRHERSYLDLCTAWIWACVCVCVCMEMTCVSLCNRLAINRLQVCHTHGFTNTVFTGCTEFEGGRNKHWQYSRQFCFSISPPRQLVLVGRKKRLPFGQSQQNKSTGKKKRSLVTVS